MVPATLNAGYRRQICFTGMQNIRGPQWVSPQDMAGFTEMCVALLQLWSASKAQSRVKRNGDARLTSQEDFMDWAG
jgi:hypothetical protein